MQRVQAIQPEAARGPARELLAAAEQAFGMVPNAAKVMANSPAVLESFLTFSAAMGKAQIGAKLHTQVKLATSEANSAPYCTSILCAIGPKVGLTAADLVASRSAHAKDHRSDAALKFARSVLETSGRVGDDDLRAVQRAGFTDADVVEIVASVVLGCFTNFLNNVAWTALDIPEAQPLVGHTA